MLKRVFDLLIVCCLAVPLLPLYLIVWLAVYVFLGSPALFSQVRPGKHGELFRMYKFRSMIDVVDANGNPLPDSERITPFGSFLRSTSLDELPGLWNVLKGDMSLVGPRPLLVEYLPLYTERQAKRHDVRPGITGWAQLNGRNAISWEQKFELDVWYVENQSFWLDLKILYLTVFKVLKRDGIVSEGQVTTEKFRGESVSGRLAIVGAGGHGRVIADLADLLGWQEIVFFDDHYSETSVDGWSLQGGLADLKENISEFEGVVVGVGNNSVRAELTAQLQQLSAPLVSLIHPSAVVSPRAKIGKGVVIFAGAVVNTDAEVSGGVILNTACSIDHDCHIGFCAHISPGAHLAGGVVVGSQAWVGIGACVIQGIRIGSGVRVGAGAAVISDLPPDITAVGVPARILQG